MYVYNSILNDNTYIIYCILAVYYDGDFYSFILLKFANILVKKCIQIVLYQS